MPASHVALLRGINLGRHNKVPMADLRKALGTAGFSDVATLIQSGNVLLTPPTGITDVADAISALVQTEFGVVAPTVIRTTETFLATAQQHPFAHLDDDLRMLQVGFLPEAPSAECIKSLDPNRSPDDSFIVQDREVYVHFANGAHKTKLTSAWFEKHLQTAVTFRNFRTVQRLAGLIEEQAS